MAQNNDSSFSFLKILNLTLKSLLFSNNVIYNQPNIIVSKIGKAVKCTPIGGKGSVLEMQAQWPSHE